MMEFTFDESPWEVFSRQLQSGCEVSASYLLALLEGEDEDTVEDAFDLLEQYGVVLKLEDMPSVTYCGDTGVRLKWEAELVQQGLKPQQLPETDPLRLYLEELAMIPAFGDLCLAAGKMAEENRKGKDNDGLRMQVVNLSLGRVVQLAEEYTGRGVLLMDLIQEGSIGLWKAAQGYTGDGTDFETLRDEKIAFCLKKAVILQARADGVGQKLRRSLEDYRSTDERLLGELGRNPTVAEIAEAMHIPVEEAAFVAAMLDNVRRVERAIPTAEPEETPEEEEQAVEDTAYFQMRQRISELLSSLSAEESQLLTLRFGLEGGQPMTPEETGRKLGITPQEVVAREAAALMKLRKEG